MQNIEIKARYSDLEAAERIAQAVGARFETTLAQIDTYFRVPQGRLKLREINQPEHQLIYYERADAAAARLSRYEIYPVTDVEQLKFMLSSALGVWKVVEKQRELYWFEEVRIHLDRVKHLGNFLELEGVINQATSTVSTRKKVDWLMQQFKISGADLIEGSYSDLLPEIPEKKGAT